MRWTMRLPKENMEEISKIKFKDRKLWRETSAKTEEANLTEK